MSPRSCVWLVGLLMSCAGTPAPAPEILFGSGSEAELALADELAHAHLAGARSARSEDGVGTLRVVVDELAMAHVRMKQLVHGYEVFGAHVVVHLTPTGAVRDVTDGRLRDLQIDPVPLYDADEAIELAVEAAGGWQRVTDPPVATLMAMRHEGVDALVWQVDVRMLDGSPQTAAPRVFVHAQEGRVVWSYDNLQSAEPGTANTAYNGDIVFPVTFRPAFSAYLLEGDQHSTTSWNNTTTNLFYWTSTTPSFEDPNGDPTTDFEMGPDAHWGLDRSLEYFATRHNRLGPDGAYGPGVVDGKLTATVNYGVDVNNAFWVGYLVFGDGDGSVFGPTVALDIVAHELTHGITEYSAGLIYNGESGALNESMSDVFAAVIEADVGGVDAGIWEIGEQMFTPGISGDAVRYMADPTADGQSADHYDTRLQDTFDNGNVHYNSGIGNLAFYLLVDGGSHPDPGKSLSTLSGIGLDRAAAIWYRALDVYMVPTTGFAGARIATAQAAIDLYGAESFEHGEVLAAWDEVGVGADDGVYGISATTGQWLGLTVEVPLGATALRTAVWGGTGDADLYVFSGAGIDFDNLACSSTNVGNYDECTVTNPAPGTYLLGIYAWDAYSGLSLEWEISRGCHVDLEEIEGNGFDEDCDGFDAACGTNDTAECNPRLTITEELARPVSADPIDGEWVEVLNRSTHAVDLIGARLQLTMPVTNMVVSDHLVLQPGEVAVFAGSRDPLSNGGIQGVAQELAPIVLPNGSHVINLFSQDGVQIDRLRYRAAKSSGDRAPRGASLSVDPDFVGAGHGVDTHWCDGRSPYGDGDFGTPGTTNEHCDWSMDVAFQYDTDGDLAEDDVLGTTVVSFHFDATSRWFTTANAGTGGGPLAPDNLSRGTNVGGQHLAFTYDDTAVTYTATRAFGEACWTGGPIVDLPPLGAFSGSWGEVGCD